MPSPAGTCPFWSRDRATFVGTCCAPPNRAPSSHVPVNRAPSSSASLKSAPSRCAPSKTVPQGNGGVKDRVPRDRTTQRCGGQVGVEQVSATKVDRHGCGRAARLAVGGASRPGLAAPPGGEQPDARVCNRHPWPSAQVSTAQVALLQVRPLQAGGVAQPVGKQFLQFPVWVFRNSAAMTATASCS